MKNIALVLLLVSALFGCLDPAADGNLVPKTVSQDPSLPSASFNGSTFHLETFGPEQAPVIVFLHRGPGVDYRSLLPLRTAVDGQRLEDRYRLVFWDQRGSGLSQRHDASEITLAAYEADLDALIDRYSPGKPVVLVGHSWGGMYAAMYLGRHPEKVAGAVLLEAGPLTGERFTEIQGEVFDIDVWSEWLNDFGWAGRALSPYDHAQADYMLMLGGLSDAQPSYHNSEQEPTHRWRMGAIAAAALKQDGERDGEAVWDFTVGLSQFPHEVLFEASELNTTIGEEFQRMQMRDFADAELHVVTGAGHDFPSREPEQTLRPIFDYLTAIAF
jgi:proline iminopeptidase